MLPLTNNNTSELNETAIADTIASSMNLVVWNDEVNTFEWVIETLIEVCNHTTEQAEQCTLLIHFKGKCAVKTGDYNTLKPMCDAITERGINATIEEVQEA
ncbi:MAG: ATP-dependent Clp protease adaptor ClpS [Bacteroidetes bacterium]|nr:ATP-dependent Clp protease adaptor ClpS [Bacteroidota bacterium]MBS1648195.1 ATP-dependent Clp protease adaptor ClpS [Bacteroidota bacterium]